MAMAFWSLPGNVSQFLACIDLSGNKFQVVAYIVDVVPIGYRIECAEVC